MEGSSNRAEGKEGGRIILEDKKALSTVSMQKSHWEQNWRRRRGPDENFVLYSWGDRKPLEDFAQMNDMMCFKGCLRQKECKKASEEAGGQLGGFIEVQVRDEDGPAQGDREVGGEKGLRSRYT